MYIYIYNVLLYRNGNDNKMYKMIDESQNYNILIKMQVLTLLFYILNSIDHPFLPYVNSCFFFFNSAVIIRYTGTNDFILLHELK